MKRSKASIFAWTLFAVVAATSLYSIVGDLAHRPAGDTLITVIEDLLWNLLGVEFAFLSVLIVSRQPRNIIGRLMMALAFLGLLDFLVRVYLAQFLTPPVEPAVTLLLAVYLRNTSWLLLILLLLFIMLLFPNGRPPSPRWRWVLRAGLGIGAFFLFFGLFPLSFTLTEPDSWTISNPIGFLPADIESLVSIAWSVALVALILLCAAAPFVRFRRAAGVEREQIKWLFFAGGLFAFIFLAELAAGIFGTDTLLADVWGVSFILSIMAIPAAIAIAILRYRLYDIDVIIRKTLVYGALTGLLVLVYFASVVLLQSLFEALTGQSSPIVIVISTLLIAALFTPLRRRLQRVIDRRFFRQKYDAQRVLAHFAETARDEVELEALTAELARVTHETVQPETVTIWLKP